MATSFAVDAFTSGLALIGADGSVEMAVAPRVDVLAHVGLRDPVAYERPDGSTVNVTSAVMAGMRLHIGANRPDTPLGLAAALGADVFWLRATLPQASVQSTVVVTGGLTAWATLAPDLRLVAEVGLGGAVSPVYFTEADGKSLRLLNGLATSTSLGLLAAF